ncbi:MAG: pyruvate ferredoxin oxidoreductase, partial [Hadesarchaea archaeon]
MRLLLNGNEAAALAAKLARVQVISAYPITPQTVVVETLAKYVADGELDAEFVKVESEHSALSVCLGASAAGARAFTATSSQGLMLMSEILYVVSGMRLPVVMANANRSLSAPLSIWNDQQDSLSVRDSGWIQLYCENNQEILDLLLQAFLLAERVSLPAMVCYDGYILSHTAEAVEVPEQAEVDAFLPPYSPAFKLDPSRPLTMGPVGVPEVYMEARYLQHRDMRRAKEEFVRVTEEFRRRFGRKYGILEEYRTEDAELLLFTMGSLMGTVREAVDRCR